MAAVAAAEPLTSAPAEQPIAVAKELACGKLDLRRKAQIARGGPADHTGEVVLIPNPDFDLDATIFRTLDSTIARKVTRDKLAVSLFWNEEVALKIAQLFSSVPPAIDHNKPLLDFMATECDFAMEHADGSFMDHLQFCYEYAVRHFQPYSPRVLLLHSICGVGTNFFPMEASKIPKLESFLDEFERLHVKAFPSMLRLLYHGPLLQELHTTPAERLAELQGLRFYMVLDNRELHMDADALWVHLNYQLIHLLDFLPVADWELNKGDGFLVIMSTLHQVLTRCGKLMAHVDLSLTPLIEAKAGPFNGASQSPKLSLGRLVAKFAPGLHLKMLNKSIGNYSEKIGHNISYALIWPERGNSRL